MRFSRARYVTLCQQSLVTAAVLAVGLTAAGGPQANAPANGPAVDSAGPSQVLAEGGSPGRTDVDTAPVTPKVREVSVTSAPSHAAARQSQPQKVQPTQTPTPPAT